jgi:probable F420-dependent oxidoreductase
VAQAAEAAGFESLWAGEHIVLPEPQVPPSPLPATFPLLDPTVAFAFIAGQTKTIRLGTGIIILPQRNPLVLAKELASLDVLSNGRLIFGVGIGYLKPEFDALGIPFADKGPRTIEYLQAIQAIWSQPQPAYHGKFVSFRGVQALPRPVQKPHPPIVFGGMTPFAFRRAVSHGNGWYGFALDLDGTKKCLAGLQEARQRSERPQELGELEISIGPSVRLDLDTVKRFADLGVQRLILLPRRVSDTELLSLTLSEEDMVDFVKQTGDTLIGRV